MSRLRHRHPEATVERFKAALTESERHVRLTLAGPFDVIVDDTGALAGRRARFHATFFHLRTGGALVIRDAGPEIGVPGEHVGKLGELLARARDSAGQEAPLPGRGIPAGTFDDHALREALATAEDVGGHLVLTTHAVCALAKLDELEMNRYLALRSDGGDRVVEVIPSEPFASRCTLRESAPTRGSNQPSHYEPLPISLREYHHVVVTPGQVVSNDRILFPDSYRHNSRKRLRNRHTDELAPRFARLQHPVDDLETLVGTYFYLDNEVRGHFGHLMTEQLSRLWAWPEAKKIDSDVKALVAINRGREMRGWEYDVYAAAGIDPDDVIFLREPVRAERLVSGTPMLSNPQYVHPRIMETWRRVGDQLAGTGPAGHLPRRIFCSRRINKRACRNADEVEALFVQQGFDIVFPEDFSLREQVRMFRGADVVAGFAGSGLFNLCFVEDSKRVVMISSEAYTARNEYLFASLLGHEIDAITSRPEIPGEFQSPFTFDHEREGHYLTEVFATLP